MFDARVLLLLGLVTISGCRAPSGRTGPEGQRLLEAAVDANQPQTVRELLDGGVDPSGTDAQGSSLLHRAAANSREEIAKLLLDHGAKVNALDADGRTPLGVAIASGGGELLLVLLEHGADPKLVTKGDWSPLHWAIGTQRLPWVKATLDAGADPSGLDGGVPVLHTAASSGTAEIVELLVESGANIEGKASQSGQTPLFAAVMHSEGMAKALVRLGANVRARDKNGRTALQFLEAQAIYHSDPVLQKRVAFVKDLFAR